MESQGLRNIRTRTARPSAQGASPCAPWSMLLPDAAEGLLSMDQERVLNQHLAGCARCSEELAEAQRGLAWLTVLKDSTPEPAETILAGILAQTTGLAEVGVHLPPLVLRETAPASHATAWSEACTGWRRWLGLGEGTPAEVLQPRLAMTGAMAFFSICLTLNLLGISVTQLHAETHHAGALPRTVADTVADTETTLVRSLQGLRLMYRLESRVNALRAPPEDAHTSSADQ